MTDFHRAQADLSEHDAQLLRSAQVALEGVAKDFRVMADEKDRHGLPSWGDCFRVAASHCEAKAKALGG